jgi:hypothetical protein
VLGGRSRVGDEGAFPSRSIPRSNPSRPPRFDGSPRAAGAGLLAEGCSVDEPDAVDPEAPSIEIPRSIRSTPSVFPWDGNIQLDG